MKHNHSGTCIQVSGNIKNTGNITRNINTSGQEERFVCTRLQ
jgi:hypothetical protein